jgi:hypothetical protein
MLCRHFVVPARRGGSSFRLKKKYAKLNQENLKTQYD